MNEQADATAHPLNAIAEQFKSSDIDTNQSGHRETASTPPSLSLLKLSSPAILIDRTLRIVWQNKAAYQLIWRFDDPIADSLPIPSIFDLLFSSAFQNRVENWKEWLHFFLDKTRHLPAASELDQLVRELPDERQAIVKRILSELEDASDEPYSSTGAQCYSLKDSQCKAFEVAVTRFESRSLMVFEPGSASAAQSGNSKVSGTDKINELVRKLSQPAKTEICILAAALHDAGTLRTEMLDEEYCHLFLRIWKICAETIEEFGGVVNQAGGTSILGYFLSTEHSGTHPLEAIQCALELKRKMLELGREWKIRKGWLHDIDLNMGIHTGVEHMASIPSGLGDHILAIGETLDIAKHLSGIASGGQIWATKTVIHSVPEKDLKLLRFGIFRTDSHRQVFIARYFSRIRDLDVTGDSGLKPEDGMGACAVTQIFDRQGHG